MRILRAVLPTPVELKVYIADNEQGKAEMPLKRFEEYVKALDTVISFEMDVDRQYEKS